MNIIRNSNNPQAMFQSMLTSNPNMKNVMALISKSGGDPKAAFYALAKEKGIDPNKFLSMLGAN